MRPTKLEWKEDCDDYDELRTRRTLNRKAEEVEALLHDLSRGSEGVATDILDNVRNRLSPEAQIRPATAGGLAGRRWLLVATSLATIVSWSQYHFYAAATEISQGMS